MFGTRNVYFELKELFIYLQCLLPKLFNRCADGIQLAFSSMARNKKANDGTKKTFFFKRWMVGLSNLMDRWIFHLDEDNDNTMGNTFWWVLVAGFLGGGISIAPQIFSKGDGITPVGRTVTIITSIVALTLIVIYGYVTILSFDNLKKRIFRGVYIFVWGIVGFGLGYALGAVIVAAVIALVFLWFILKMFGAAIFDSNGGGGGRKRQETSNEPERFKLEDGTVVEDTGFGSYRDVHGYDVYTRDGDTFTKKD